MFALLYWEIISSNNMCVLLWFVKDIIVTSHIKANQTIEVFWVNLEFQGQLLLKL